MAPGKATHHSGDYFSFTQFSLANTCGPPMCRFQSAVMFRLSSCWGSLCLNSYFDIWEIFALQKFFLLAHLKRKKTVNWGLEPTFQRGHKQLGLRKGSDQLTPNALKWPCPPLACFTVVECPIVPRKLLHLELWEQIEGKLPSPPLPYFNLISLFLFNVFASCPPHQN